MFAVFVRACWLTGSGSSRSTNPEERFANRQRIRAGLGYRRNFNWRCELLYIWTRSLDTIDEGFSTTENIVDRRVKRLF